jgi:hypothetical protein
MPEGARENKFLNVWTHKSKWVVVWNETSMHLRYEAEAVGTDK